MVHAAATLPSATTMVALLPLIVLVVGLIGYSLVRLWRSGPAPYLPRWAWAALILLVVPWGAIGYLVLARDSRSEVGPAPTPASTDRISPVVVRQVPAAPAATAEIAVTTDGLTRDYGGGAGLFDVDLRVPHGAVYGLVGPNGAGKSTLLSILTAVRRPDSGTVRTAVPRSRIAVCPDVPQFDHWLTAYEVVDLARYFTAPAAAEEAVWGALNAAGLADAAGRRVGGFSRGMTQRLGLAAALVGDPELLLLDEPTSALDPAGRADILDLVADMRGHRTVIFSSHILADVQRVADHVGVLRHGRLLYQGATRTLIDEHLHPSWTLRLATPAADVAATLSSQPWARRVESLGPDLIRVDADTMEHGERGIPDVLAACGARLMTCEPREADLEAAFLALTGAEEDRI
jgi:ABC-2 type transport system ATP-binding protein